MINKILTFLLALVMMLLPLALHADSCTDLYNQGVTMRQTQSIEAQTRAIALFKEARECSDDEDFISRCNRQIEVCTRAITRLGGQVVLHDEPEPEPEPETAVEPEDIPTDEPGYIGVINIEPDDSVATYTPLPAMNTPTFNVNLTFKGKNPEPQTYRINPDDDVRLVFAPDWVDVEVGSDSVKITPQKNTTGDERTCDVMLAGRSATLIIHLTQAKK